MRGTDCNRATFRVAGYFKPVTKWSIRRRLFVLFIKKCLRIKSPSIMAISDYEYEYDYFKNTYRELKSVYWGAYEKIKRGGGQNKCVRH